MAFERFIESLNVLSGPSTVVTTTEAFPNIYPTAVRYGAFASLPLIAAQLGLRVVADRKLGTR